MKNEVDLRQNIADFDIFCNFLNNWANKHIIDTGRLAEWYCSISIFFQTINSAIRLSFL